jgi:GSCFA family
VSNPYKGLDSRQFWSSAVADVAPGSLDPVVQPKFRITKFDRVATMGSCFAQHISRHLQRSGMTYFIPESGDSQLTAEERVARQYGVFSARYGNVYTVRQALQLFDRAFGDFVPEEKYWKSGVGWVDPFRPRIEPQPWASPELVASSRQEHLSAVQRVFVESNVLVFTLGLTEAFMSVLDGSVLPVAPGVSGGTFSNERYRFVNFSVAEVVEDLHELVEKVCVRNPSIRIVLTVSPVPLIATYESRHVLVSNTVSKSVLRVAADEIAKSYDNVEYFPSYEIIAGSALGARYFDETLRQVGGVGVRHVMRIFEKHMVVQSAKDLKAARVTASLGEETQDVICDEEAIERAVTISSNNVRTAENN